MSLRELRQAWRQASVTSWRTMFCISHKNNSSKVVRGEKERGTTTTTPLSPSTWTGGSIIAYPGLPQQPATQCPVRRWDTGASSHLGTLPTGQWAHTPLGPLFCCRIAWWRNRGVSTKHTRKMMNLAIVTTAQQISLPMLCLTVYVQDLTVYVATVIAVQTLMSQGSHRPSPSFTEDWRRNCRLDVGYIETQNAASYWIKPMVHLGQYCLTGSHYPGSQAETHFLSIVYQVGILCKFAPSSCWQRTLQIRGEEGNSPRKEQGSSEFHCFSDPDLKTIVII